MSPPNKRQRLDLDCYGWKFSTNDWTLDTDQWQTFYRKCRHGKFVEANRFSYPQDMDLPDQPESYFVRDCYRGLLAETKVKSGHLANAPILILGQPGIGKKVALLYLIGSTLSEEPNEPLVFINRTSARIFIGDKVWNCPTPTCEPGLPRKENHRCKVFVIWDVLQEYSFPNAFFSNYFKVVQASSPNRENYGWASHKAPKVVGLPHLTKDELEQSFTLYPNFGVFMEDLQSALRDVTLPCHSTVLRARSVIQQWCEDAKNMAIEGNSKAPAVVSGEGEEKGDDVVVDEIRYLLGTEAERDVENILRELAKNPDPANVPQSLRNRILVTHAMRAVGLSAREVNTFIYHSVESGEDRAKEAVGSVITVDGLRELVRQFRSDKHLDKASHKLITVTPLSRPPSRYDLSEKCRIFPDPLWAFSLSSPDVEQAFMDRISTELYDKRVELFHLFRDDPYQAISADRLFEAFAPRLFEDHKASISLYTMSQKQCTADDHPTFITSSPPTRANRPFPVPVHHHTKLSFRPGTLHNVKKELDRFIFSKVTTTPLFDGVLLSRRGEKFELWVLQITSSYNPHKGSSEGYALLQGIIDDIIENYPGSSVKLSYVLVKPDMGHDEVEVGEWKMPKKWLEHKGDVFCAYLPVK
ncbi:hypothetical protein PQX77_006898 [Marasmius sp. AFHP31]|nr:hypothetical protein PQX77_006898 [Marasmius sp. AFHP31]